MNSTHRPRLNSSWTGLSLCAAVLLVAAGCSTIVNQGRYSPKDKNDPKKMDPWVWGNAAFAVFPPVAVVGVGIDAVSGNWWCRAEGNSSGNAGSGGNSSGNAGSGGNSSGNAGSEGNSSDNAGSEGNSSGNAGSGDNTSNNLYDGLDLTTPSKNK